LPSVGEQKKWPKGHEEKLKIFDEINAIREDEKDKYGESYVLIDPFFNIYFTHDSIK